MKEKDRSKIINTFLHSLALNFEMCNVDKVHNGLNLISSWSYAHRVGNGEYSEKEQQKLIDSIINKMKEY